MNTSPFTHQSLIALAVAAALMIGCSAAPVKPEGAETARNRLTQLQNNPELASRAPLALKDADIAVSRAEKPQTDKALAAHLVLMADRKVSTAQALAEGQLAVDQRKQLGERREAMRLQARTQEADSANNRAAIARTEAADQTRAANSARADANTAREATADAQRNTQELQKQMDELQAKATDRGLVLTLGDVLFSSGTAELNGGGTSNLGKLAGFLNKYPDRTVLIEGHTDSIGTDDYNQRLSQHRADAVKAYLVKQGVASTRLAAAGKGKGSPVGDNSSATGRQENRRVEVIIENEISTR